MRVSILQPRARRVGLSSRKHEVEKARNQREFPFRVFVLSCFRDWVCAAALIVLVAGSAQAFPIRNYVTRMAIQPDSSINVTETITADFTGEPHHGIFREIPLTGKDKWGNNYRFRVQDVEVKDQSGSPLRFVRSFRSGRMRLKIGSPDVMVSDVRTYVITYHLWRGVHFFSEHDELYWNPVGPEWEETIEKAGCIVTLPKDAPPNTIRTQSYSGSYGATNSDAATSDTPNNHTARFWATRPLSPGEAMTIVAGWPKGIVNRPSFKQEALWFISDNGYFFLVPAFLVGLVLYWRKVGADPDTGKSEVVSYDPPDKLNPAELGTLIDERVDMRDISASIVDLAVRGFIKITDTSQPGFLHTDVDYTFELTKPFKEVIEDPNLTPFEASLVHGLFEGNQSRDLSDLKNDFYVHVAGLQSSLYDSMKKHGYFTHSPESTRQSYRGAGIAIVIVGVGLAIASLAAENFPIQIPIGWSISIALCGVILAFAARTMPRKTAKGKDALLAARGFEEYLSRAERKEIEYQERQSYFEKFLPYAMAFGIAAKWAKAFDGIQITPPDWYTGRDDTFHPVIFASRMDYAASSWGSTMTSQPRSSSSGGGSSFFSGGSGFSGGFSGGGGGGGGGGGW